MELNYFQSLLQEEYERRNYQLIDIAALKKKWFRNKLLTIARQLHKSEIKSALHGLQVVITCLESEDTHFDELEITKNHLVYLKVCFLAASTMAGPFVKKSMSFCDKVKELHYIEDQYKSVLDLLSTLDFTTTNNNKAKSNGYFGYHVQKECSNPVQIQPSSVKKPKIVLKNVAIQTDQVTSKNSSAQTNKITVPQKENKSMEQKILNHLIEIQGQITTKKKKDTEILKLSNQLAEANKSLINSSLDKKEFQQLQLLNTMKDKMLREVKSELKIEQDKYCDLRVQFENVSKIEHDKYSNSRVQFENELKIAREKYYDLKERFKDENNKKYNLQKEIFNCAEKDVIQKINKLNKIFGMTLLHKKEVSSNLRDFIQEHVSKLEMIRREKLKLTENVDDITTNSWPNNFIELIFDDKFDKFIYFNLTRSLNNIYQNKQVKNTKTIQNENGGDELDEQYPVISDDGVESPITIPGKKILIKAQPGASYSSRADCSEEASQPISARTSSSSDDCLNFISNVSKKILIKAQPDASNNAVSQPISTSNSDDSLNFDDGIAIPSKTILIKAQPDASDDTLKVDCNVNSHPISSKQKSYLWSTLCPQKDDENSDLDEKNTNKEKRKNFKSYQNFIKEQNLYDYLRVKLKTVDEDTLLKAFESVREARGTTFLTMKRDDIVEDMKSAIHCQLAVKGNPQEVEVPSVFLRFDSPDNESTCIICFETMSQKNRRVLICHHEFHKKCIEKWLKNANQCPMCRVFIDSSISKSSDAPTTSSFSYYEFPPLQRR